MNVAKFTEDDRDVLGGRLRYLCNRLGYKSINALSRAAGLGESTANSLAGRSLSTRKVAAGDMDSFFTISDHTGCEIRWLTTGKGPAYKGEPEDPLDLVLQEHEEVPLCFARALRAHAREAAPAWDMSTWERVVQGILEALSPNIGDLSQPAQHAVSKEVTAQSARLPKPTGQTRIAALPQAVTKRKAGPK